MTSPLRTALRELASSSDPVRLPPPDVVRARGDQRRRRTTVSLAAVAVLVSCSVLVQVLATQDSSDRDTQPAEPLPSPTARTETPRPEQGPSEHRIATGDDRFSAHAIAARDGTFVVVGDSSDIVEPGPPIYWSEDGVDWQPPSAGRGPDSVNVTDVIATDEGFLAVGIRGDKPGAWRSVDGHTWVESPVITGAAGGVDGLWGITATRLGYYAWGSDGGRATLWRSTDGRAWATVADESVFDLPRKETICAVRDVTSGLRATGVVAPPNSREGNHVAWTSADGETWVRADATPGRPALWCDSPEELGHWEARSDAGLIRIDPYGPGDVVELVPTPQ